MERIGFLPRLGAAFIDGVIILVGSNTLYFIFGKSYLGALVIQALIVGYFSMDIFKAATLGKLLLKLIIRNQDGSPASRDALIKRWAIKSSGPIINLLAVFTTLGILQLVGLVCSIIVILGAFFIFTEGSQAFHDKFAGTAVFKS